MPEGPAAWSRLLRDAGMSEGEFLHTLALLGILRMLDERDAAERAGWEFEGRKVSRPPMPSFEEVWKTRLPTDAKRWGEAYEAGGYAQWDTSTRDMRHQLAPLMDLSKQTVNTVGLVLHLLDAFDPTQKQTFAEWFRHHFEELIWTMEEDRISRGSSPSWAFQELLRDSCPLQPHHRVLLAGFNSAQLLTELMGRIRALARYTPQGRLTNIAMHGVSVRTNSGSFALVAWAILLSHDVELPDVRHESQTELIAEPVYDWVLVSPPWGLTTQEPDYTLPFRTNRVESILLLHALKVLQPEGRLIAWLPRAMARVTTEEELRQWLLHTHHLAAVVELPGEAVNRRGLSSMLLLVGKQQPGERVFFAGEALVKRCFEDWENAPLHPQLKLLAQLMRSSMGAANDDDARAFREDTMKVSPVYAEERDEMLALGRSMINGLPPPEAGPRFSELRSGLLPIHAMNNRGTEFAWPRDFDSGLQRSLRLLTEANPKLRLTTLQEVAEIVKGVSYTRERTLPSAELRASDRAHHVGIIRVSDLSRKMDPDVHLPFCQDPALLLTEAAAVELQERHFLQPWDILLSSAGTVDKVSVFANEEQRCVAAQQIIIIRPKAGHGSKTIRHIVGLLVSDAGKAWLRGLATGSVIQHLVLRDLREMPMIDGPDTLLDAIGEHLLHGHPLETAASVFDDRLRQDPTLSFFSECEAMRATFAPESANAVEAWLGSLGSALQTWKDNSHNAIPKGRLRDWWIEVDALVYRLLRALRTNPGYDRLTLLMFWQQAFAASEKGLAESVERINRPLEDSTVPNADELQREGITQRGKTLLRRMGELAAREVSQQCQPVKWHVILEPQEVTVATPTVVTVDLVNLSPLSLQDVSVSVGEGQNYAKLLAHADGLKLPVLTHAAYAGPLPIKVQWKARTLDGREFSGVIEKQIAVGSLRTAVLAKRDIGKNPFRDARTLKDEADSVFYGRKSELARMSAELEKTSGSTVLLIEGNRRAGKTSLFHHFNRHYLPTSWVAAYCSFQSAEGTTEEGGGGKGVPTREVYYVLAKSIVEAVVRSGVNVRLEGAGEIPASLRQIELERVIARLLRPIFKENAPYETLCQILQQCLDAMPDKRLLLEIDEFDRLQEGITSGVTSDQVPENIRHLFQTHNAVAGMLAGSRSIRRLREDYWNVLFGIGDPIILSGLAPEDVRALITEPVAGRITYAPDAVELIAHLSAGQPRIVQTLCSRLFDLCAAQPDSPLITTDMVHQVAAEKATQYEHFHVLWKSVKPTSAQLLALSIRQLNEGSEPTTFSVLLDHLRDLGVPVSPPELDDLLGQLKDLEVISEHTAEAMKIYRIHIPLFSLWLDENEDLQRLRESAIYELT